MTRTAYSLPHREPIPNSTLVRVARTSRAFGDVNEYGPMTIADMLAEGLNSSSCGTVSVSVTMAEGPRAGAHVHSDKRGQYWVQWWEIDPAAFTRFAPIARDPHTGVIDRLPGGKRALGKRGIAGVAGATTEYRLMSVEPHALVGWDDAVAIGYVRLYVNGEVESAADILAFLYE